jgi:hypothetical protein
MLFRLPEGSPDVRALPAPQIKREEEFFAENFV